MSFAEVSVCTIKGKGILWKGAISVEPSCFNDLHVLVMNRVFSAEVITPTTVVPFLSVEAICLIQATGIVNP